MNVLKQTVFQVFMATQNKPYSLDITALGAVLNTVTCCNFALFSSSYNYFIFVGLISCVL